jgi:ABC-type multidrug transport system ATPase subunit
VTIDFDRLEIDGVTRYYGRRRALHNVTFTCGAGEVVALLGPNGAGKSTLLAVISTLIAPNGGEVRYGSHTPAPPDWMAGPRAAGLSGADGP